MELSKRHVQMGRRPRGRSPGISEAACARDEVLARTVAAICGTHSGAALALAELDSRRRQGRQAWITHIGGSWLVVGPDQPIGMQRGQ